MSNPADEYIIDLIATLCSEVDSCRFARKFDQMQMHVNKIAQLRASMEPVIVQKKTKS